MDKKVMDPKPNQHKWCGILRSYDNSNDLLANQDYVFFKANRQSHFISQGTVISKLLVWDCLQIDKELKNFVGNNFSGNNAILERIKKDIYECQAEVGDKCKLIIISGIDKEKTSPLCNAINDIIEGIFSDPKWLDVDSERKGSDDIRLGMSLPSW